MTKHSHLPYTSTCSSTLHNTNRNNGRYTTNIHTDPHTVTTTDIKQTYAIYIHLLSLGPLPQEAITKYCAHLHHTLAALKRDFPVAPLPNSKQTKSPFLKSYLHKVDTKSHPSPLCPLCNTHDTHHPFNCSHIHTTLSPLELLDRWRDMLAGGQKAR